MVLLDVAYVQVLKPMDNNFVESLVLLHLWCKFRESYLYFSMYSPYRFPPAAVSLCRLSMR